LKTSAPSAPICNHHCIKHLYAEQMVQDVLPSAPS